MVSYKNKDELREIRVDITEEMRQMADEMASFYMQECDKNGMLNQEYVCHEYFYVGCMGEYAAQRYFNLPIEKKDYIDFSHDFQMNGDNIEVKSNKLKQPLRQVKEGYKVFVNKNNRVYDEKVIFTKISPQEQYAYLLGWMPGKTIMDKCPVIQTRNMPYPARVVWVKYLNHIDTLGDNGNSLDRWL